MCGTLADETPAGETLGIANLGPPKKDTTRPPPIAWVCPFDDLVFLHEVGHIFGCEHDRDHETEDWMMDSNYGYHMKGSNMRTIMAYENKNHEQRIPRFSSKDQAYCGVPLGDSRHDNRGQIMKTRFQVSKYGDESGNCGHHSTSCEEKCSQKCCPMYRLC